MTDGEKIFVRLLGEAVDVWRPVKAECISTGLYRLSEDQLYDQDTEKWEFVPGSVVGVEKGVDPDTRHPLLRAIAANSE